MNELTSTAHATARKTQRGFRTDDFDHIISHGTPVGDMEIMLTDKDVEHAIRKMKKEIQALERLKSRIVVVDGRRVITAYPLNKRKQRDRLRRARTSGW